MSCLSPKTEHIDINRADCVTTIISAEQNPLKGNQRSQVKLRGNRIYMMELIPTKQEDPWTQKDKVNMTTECQARRPNSQRTEGNDSHLWPDIHSSFITRQRKDGHQFDKKLVSSVLFELWKKSEVCVLVKWKLIRPVLKKQPETGCDGICALGRLRQEDC